MRPTLCLCKEYFMCTKQFCFVYYVSTVWIKLWKFTLLSNKLSRVWRTMKLLFLTKINFSLIFQKFWDLEFTHFCGLDGDFWTKCTRIDSKKWLSTLLSPLTQSGTKICVYEILISTIDNSFQAVWRKIQIRTPPSQNVRAKG